MASLPVSQIFFPFPNNTLITSGLSGFIHKLNAVLKIAKPDCLEEHFKECAIYSRLGRHPHIVDVYHISQEQDLLVLEKMEMSLRAFLRQPKSQPLSDDDVFIFAEQLAEVYGFIHDRKVFHVDIGAHNVLIDKSHSQLKLCDFAGSSLDGSEPLVCAGTRAQCPWDYGPNIATELFAFGSLLYELSAGREPYDDKPSSTVNELFQSKQFPATSHLILGPVISKCWTGRYNNTEEILNELHDLQRVREHCSSETALHQGIQYGGLFLSFAIFIWLSRRWNR